jgi:hypothetical protein
MPESLPEGDPTALTLDEVSLSAEAAAVLEFTSDIGAKPSAGGLTYITSKEAYIRAGLSAVMAEHARIGSAKLMEDVEIQVEIYKTVAEHLPQIKHTYNSALPKIEAGNLIGTRGAFQMEWDILNQPRQFGFLCLESLIRSANMDGIPFDVVASELNKKLRIGYN